MRYLDWYHSKKSRKQIFLFIYISFILDISGYSLLVPLVTYVVEKHSGGSFEIGLCFSGYALCQLISMCPSGLYFLIFFETREAHIILSPLRTFLFFFHP